MDWLALLGVLLVAYSLFVFFLVLTKKPQKVWDMQKVQVFRKVLGDTGTTIFFIIFALILLGVGIWLMVG